MEKFRSAAPIRRRVPTYNPTGENWGQHKSDLKADFNSRCGYCDSKDEFRHTYFEVDHFVPKEFIKRSMTITLTHYENLVYSCKFCNNGKSSKWPSQHDKVFNDGTKGFVDPCDSTYESHFYRTPEGGIMWRTELGRWMHEKAFKFDERQAAIKLLWNLDRIDNLIKRLSTHLNNLHIASTQYATLKVKIGDLAYSYHRYHSELIAYYNSI
ncbi:MAG: HNH endonuclease signature motif containing protein [Bacteroidota bacterium]